MVPGAPAPIASGSMPVKAARSWAGKCFTHMPDPSPQAQHTPPLVIGQAYRLAFVSPSPARRRCDWTAMSSPKQASWMRSQLVHDMLPSRKEKSLGSTSDWVRGFVKTLISVTAGAESIAPVEEPSSNEREPDGPAAALPKEGAPIRHTANSTAAARR